MCACPGLNVAGRNWVVRLDVIDCCDIWLTVSPAFMK
jgi:hypothetical protein